MFIRTAVGLIAAFVLAGGPVFGAIPQGYYDSADGKTGSELRAALHQIIGNHRVVSYDSLWEHYVTTDAGPDGRPWCIYSEYPFPDFQPKQGGEPGKVGSFLTREHSWPKGWWGGDVNPAYSDLFHVILGDAHVNGQKGIKPLGEADGTAKVCGVSRTGPARAGMGFSGHVFEPADAYKGDFARAYLYFAVRYLTGEGALDCYRSPMIFPDGASFRPWARELLLRWHASDPVSERERVRNEAVFRIQGNRNPFIDHPEFAERAWAESDPGKPLVGVDANYALDMMEQKTGWKLEAPFENGFFATLRRGGVRAFRVRVWTNDRGRNGLRYALRTAELAQENGLKPLVALFFSEDWADMEKQPLPSRWEELSPEALAVAIEHYAEATCREFLARGIEPETIQIGNEIDFGFCGVFEADWSRRVSLEYMQQKIWPQMVPRLLAAQRGIRKVFPRVRLLLQLARWYEMDYARAFVEYFESQGVAIDDLGVSYFPTSLPKDNSLEEGFAQFRTLAALIKKPITICEYAYPSEAIIVGQFAAWNHPVDGYPLNEDGQRRWIAEFLRRAGEEPNLKAHYYWSPEWYDSPIWRSFSLFHPDGSPKPAWEDFLLGSKRDDASLRRPN